MKAEPGKPLTNEDIQRLISNELTSCQEYLYGADNIVAERERNYDYYRGIMNDLPAPPTRSRVIEPVVANYIGLLLPNLMRIFTSGRNIGEYVSPKPDMQQVVRVITRFINDVVLRKDNRGELLLNDWALDGLIQKLGIVMWWWEERFEAKDQILEGVPDGPALALTAEKIKASGAEIVEATPVESVVPGPQEPVPGIVCNLKVRVKENKSKCCIEVIPPEEFRISGDARNLEDGVLKGHVTGVMVGDAIAAGYDLDVINNLPSWSPILTDRTQRYTQEPALQNRDQSSDGMLRKVPIGRGILKCDYDGSGLKDWYVVWGGDDNAPKLLEIEPYNYQVGFADFCPEPIPHTVYGRCPADRLAMIQKIQTVLVRQMNDNLFLANTPQREVVMDWIVKPDQLMNMSPGASILVKQPGAIREIAIPFVADKALVAMQYYDAQAELTTGTSRNAAGLDPEVLQNQSATAAANQQSAALGRVEMIARIWAQGGMRKLFRGVFQCIKAYQDFARVVQIDGAPQTIDPSLFEGIDDLDVNINTGLGAGNRERDYMVLSGIEASQKEALAQLGPNNPIVDFQKLVKTLQLKAEAAGIAYPENFFGDAKNPDGTPWVPEPPAPPQPSPDVVVNAQALVQIEQIKADAANARAVAEIASKERIAYREQDLKAAADAGKLQIDTVKVAVEAAKVDAAMIAKDMQKAEKADAEDSESDD